MPYVFGYGSLLLASSASRTLGRKVSASELIICSLSGYRRTWTAKVEVFRGGRGESVQALFLDLTVTDGADCNGVLLQVSAVELERLDLRERGYQRSPVRVATSHGMMQAEAYIVPEKMKSVDGVVMEEYTKIISKALLEYAPDFNKQFEQSTDVPPGILMAGAYTFNSN